MQDEDVHALIRILRRILSDEYLTMQGLARRLGFTTSHLSLIFSGKRRPGLRFMWAVLERYPETRALLPAHRPARPRAERDLPDDNAGLPPKR